MDSRVITLLLLVIVLNSAQGERGTSQQRSPRVNGRIVKLYSGAKSGNGFHCRTEGFHEDSYDCSVFYRCVNTGNGRFITFKFQCGPDTIYDPETSVCNHPTSARRSHCGGIKHAESIERDENEIDYNQKQKVPNSIIMNQTQRKKHKEAYEIDKTEQNNDSANDIDHTIRPTSRPRPRPTRPIKGAFACISDGLMGDNTDCGTFHRCVGNGRGGFLKYTFRCAEGTVWDEDIEACNFPWAVKSTRCGRSNVISESEYLRTRTNELKSKAKGTNQSQNQVNYGSDSSQTQYQTNNGSNVNQKQNQTNYGDRTNQTQNQINYGDSVSQSQSQANYGSQSSQIQTQINHGNQASQSQMQIINHPQSNQQSDVQETTTKRHGEGNTCTSSGFMGDTNDCKKFYRCVDNGKGGYTRYEFKCGEGTVWDQSNEACNHEWAVTGCRGSNTQQENEPSGTTTTMKITTSSGTTTDKNMDYDQGNGQQLETTTHVTTAAPTTQSTSHEPTAHCTTEGFMSDKNNCKKFYRCVGNGRGGYTKYEFSCGDGTVWDQEIQGCNHGSETNCQAGSNSQDNSSEQHKPVNDEIVTENNQQTTQERQETTQKTTTTRTVHSNGKECQNDGFFGDNKDCKKFYRCVDNGRGGYTKYEFSCGEGTQWDQEIQGCNHATKDCRPQDMQQQTARPQTTQTTEFEQQQEDKTTEENIGTSQSTSSGKCSAEGFYGDPNDCKKFYRCVDNGRGSYTKYDFSCGEGTVWDQEIQGCNHESDVTNCGSNSDQTTKFPESQKVTTSRVDDEYQQTEKSSTTKQPNKGKCQSEGFYADEEDCKKFYRCVDNGNGGYTKYDFTCGEGTAWDQEIQGCNHENTVNCNNNNKNPPQSEKPEQTTTSPPVQQNDEQNETTHAAPCDDEENNGNQDQSPSNGKCNAEGYYGDEDDCKKFYRCVDNGKGAYTKYDFTCGEGTIWDQDITTCNHPQDVSNPSCRQNNNHQSSSSAQQSSTQGSTCDKSTTTQGSSCGSQSTTESSSMHSESTTRKTNGNFSCPHAGFYANPNDCKKFYRCVDWDGSGNKYSIFHFDCGEGTIWDPALDTCNYEESVYPARDCSGSQQQAATTEQSETTSKTEQTTEKETTTEGTTSSSTTKKSTTSKTTTTTESQSTTEEPKTTEKSTTEQSTTEQTTQKQTTEQQTTQQTTSEKETEGTTQEQEETTQSSTESTTDSTSSNKCPETDDDQNLYVCPTGFRRHPKYCNLFYQCTENDDNHDVKVAVFHCPNNTIYDETNTQCLEEDQTDQKCDGEYADSRRFRRLDDNSNPPFTMHRNRLLCPGEGHYAFDKQDHCSPVFLKCRRSDKSMTMRGYIFQCPTDYVYWAVSRRCERASRMKGCSGSNNAFLRRWEIPVEMLNVAV